MLSYFLFGVLTGFVVFSVLLGICWLATEDMDVLADEPDTNMSTLIWCTSKEALEWPEGSKVMIKRQGRINWGYVGYFHSAAVAGGVHGYLDNYGDANTQFALLEAGK